jgi:sec-independent protein translocase protein TatA
MFRSPWHWVVVILVVLLLFGAKRLPDLARSLGRSLRIIKAETKGLMEDDVAGKAEPKTGRQPLTISDDEISPVTEPRQTRDIK